MPTLALCKWSADIVLKDRNKYEEKYKKDCIISNRIDYYSILRNSNQISSYNTDTEGDLRLKELINALNKLDIIHDGKYKRSKGQRIFHKAFIGAALKKIYGKDIYRNLQRLLIEYDLDELRSDVIVCTARRFGKTMSVALFVAAYILTQPNAEVSIFSTGRRASRKILALIWKIIVDLTGDPSVIVTYNMEILEVKSGGNSISKCLSYPSKVQIDNCIEKTEGEFVVVLCVFFYSHFFLIDLH